jgi:diguanylate cyclase (GGDEF)-like protein/PAS domain S-box-containing protein
MLSATFGGVVMIAWFRHWTALLRSRPDGWPIAFTTALGLVITGVAVAGLSVRPGRASRSLLTVAAGYDVVLGLGTLTEYATGHALGIDHLIGPAYLSGPGVPAGRVAPGAAACWAILGATLLVGRIHRGRRATWASLPGAVVVALAIAALFSYTAGLRETEDVDRISGMAPGTAIGLALLGVAVMVLARPAPDDEGPGPWWALPAGLLAFAVDVFGWLVLAGGARQAVAPEAIRATGLLGLLLAVTVGIVIRQNLRVRRIARALQESEARQRSATLAYRSLTENSPDFVVRYSRSGRRLYANPALAKVYGLPPEALVGRVLGAPDDAQSVVIEPDSVALMRREIVEVFEHGTSSELEIAYRAGSEQRTAHYRLVPEYDEGGAVTDVLGLGRDLTELKRVQSELQERESRYRDVFDNSVDALFLLSVSPDGQHFRNLEINPALERSTGIGREQMIGRLIEETVDSETAEIVNAKYRRCVQEGATIEEEVALNLPAGRRWYHSTLIPAHDADGHVHRIVGITRDITARRQAERALADSEERFRLAFDDSLVGMALLSVESEPHFRHQRVNAALCEFLGLLPDDLLGRRQAEVLPPHDGAAIEAAYEALMRGALSSYRTESRFRHADGETVWGLLGATLVRDAAGSPLYLLCQVEDITARKRAEEQLVFRALHDDLTGLPNRALLLEHLNNALARARRTGDLVAVLFLDLDDFKSVNDSLGHSAGDELLARVAVRIKANVRASDIAARLGGDEFVVVCENLSDLAGATAVADQLQRGLSQEIPLQGHTVSTPTSIGIAVSHPGSTPENLLRDADAAMYAAKNRGGRRWQPADASPRVAAMRVLSVEAELRRAVERDELRLHYQPLVDLDHEDIVSVEALLRWQHPRRGLLLPADFVDVAEQRGLIVEIGRWVLHTACGQAAQWLRRYGPGAPSLAVNVSSRQLGHSCLCAQVQAVLDDAGLPPQRLSLEVTESQLLAVGTSSATDLRAVAEQGVKIAVDDFGTGYAGFEYLRRLPVDELKIPESFVQGVPDDRTHAAITAGVVSLGVNLGLTVVAEGIQTPVQLEALRAMGCTWGQGFLWYAAMPPLELDEVLAGCPLAPR